MPYHRSEISRAESEVRADNVKLAIEATPCGAVFAVALVKTSCSNVVAARRESAALHKTRSPTFVLGSLLCLLCLPKPPV